MACPPFLGVTVPSPPQVIHRPHTQVLSACPKSGCMTNQKFPFSFTEIGRTSFLASGVAKPCCVRKELSASIPPFVHQLWGEKSPQREVNKVNQTSLGDLFGLSPPPTHTPCLVIGIDPAPQCAQASWAWGSLTTLQD